MAVNKRNKSAVKPIIDNSFTKRLQSDGAQAPDSQEAQDYASKQEAELQASRLSLQQTDRVSESQSTTKTDQQIGGPANSPVINHDDQADNLQSSQESERNQSSLASKLIPAGGQIPGISGLSADSASELLKDQAKKKIKLWLISVAVAASPYIAIFILIILAAVFIGVPTYCGAKRGYTKNMWSFGMGTVNGTGGWSQVALDSLSGCTGPAETTPNAPGLTIPSYNE